MSLPKSWKRTRAPLFERCSAMNQNPLELVHLYQRGATADAMCIAEALVDPAAEDVWDHWKTATHFLLTGLILHVLYKSCDDGTTGRTARFDDIKETLGDTSKPNKILYQAMAENRHGDISKDEKFHPGIQNRIVAFVGRVQLGRDSREMTAIQCACSSALLQEIYQ